MGAAAGAAGGASLAAAGFKMYGDYLSSRGEAQGKEFEAELEEQKAEYGRLKANQTNAQMSRNLAISLGHLDSIRAAQHTDQSSPTGAAVRGFTEERGTEAKGITVENILQQSRMDEANAAYLRTEGANILLAGDVAMAGDFAGGIGGGIQSAGTAQKAFG